MNFEDLIVKAPQSVKNKLEDLKTLRENPLWHPEESAYEHVKIVTERCLGTGNPNLIATGLLHDICKFDTHHINPKTNWPTSPGHELAAIRLMERDEEVQLWITNTIGADFDTVHYLVKQHMRVKQMNVMRQSKQLELMNHPLFHLLDCFTKFDSMHTKPEVITEYQENFKQL